MKDRYYRRDRLWGEKDDPTYYSEVNTLAHLQLWILYLSSHYCHLFIITRRLSSQYYHIFILNNTFVIACMMIRYFSWILHSIPQCWHKLFIMNMNRFQKQIIGLTAVHCLKIPLSSHYHHEWLYFRDR